MIGEYRIVRRPARYTKSLLPVFADCLAGCTRVLDPFAGTGRVFDLCSLLPGCQIEAVEIEPEWCSMNPRTTLGNALALPWTDGFFDGVVTSPTYGNRMADRFTDHQADKKYHRNTYRHAIGRVLHPDNSGQMQWGDKYMEFHKKAWSEVRRALCDGGIFVLNVKDHIRAGTRQHVTDWHIGYITDIGFSLVSHKHVNTPGQRYGQNWQNRIDYESVISFRKQGGRR